MSTDTSSKSPSSPSDDERFRYTPHLSEWVMRPREPHLDTCPAKANQDATCVCGGAAR